MKQAILLFLLTHFLGLSPIIAQNESNDELRMRIQDLETRVEALERIILEGGLGIPDLSEPMTQPNNQLVSWRRLQSGMTVEQVRNILGEPLRVQRSGSLLTWYYSARFTSSYLVFMDDRLFSWNEPDN